MKDKKTLFITGGTGFIGQHLVTFFIEQGHQIILPVRNKNKVPHAFLEKNTHICYAHLEDKVYIKEIFQKFSPDVIMHFSLGRNGSSKSKYRTANEKHCHYAKFSRRSW